MSFLTDAGVSWLQQKRDLERLQGVMGPLEAQDQQLMGQMQQNVQGGLLQHMGQQYMDRMGQRTGLSAFGLGSDQEYKPWQAMAQQGLLNRGPFQAPTPPPLNNAINVPPGTKGLKSKLSSLFMMGG
jgi:hypothetical protein